MKNRASGFTLIETMVAMAIFSVIAIAITTFIIDSQKVNFQIMAQTDASSMAQQALDDLRWRLEQSRMILDADSGYLPLLDLEHAPPVEGKLVLPKIEPTGSLTPRASGKDPEFAAESVGNALLFVEALPPFRDPKSGRLIDCYRFLLYYIAEGPRHEKFGPLPNYLDLMLFQSVTYADYAQVDSLPKDLAPDVIRALETAGITFTWESTAPAIAAFSRMTHGEIQIPPEPKHKILAKQVESAVPGLGRVMTAAGSIAYSVATNTPGDLPIHLVVPKYAKPSNGFPNGFEVEIAGPSHGRKVLARLVLVAETHGRFFSRENQMLAAVWD